MPGCATASLEARIVAYADKRAGQRLEPMAERFASWRRRYPSGWTDGAAAGGVERDGVDLAERHGKSWSATVCGAAGVRPDQVRRLRWSRARLREPRHERDVPVIAYYRGDDGWSLDRAVDRSPGGSRRTRARGPTAGGSTGAETNAAAIGERVATAPLFGGGTVAVVVDPAPLLRAKADREALEAAIGTVAPGNALVFIEQGDAGTKRSAALQGLEAAVLKAGGEAGRSRRPRAGELARLDHGPRHGARDAAPARRGEGARPARRRVRQRGRRRPPADGRARRRASSTSSRSTGRSSR